MCPPRRSGRRPSGGSCWPPRPGGRRRPAADGPGPRGRPGAHRAAVGRGRGGDMRRHLSVLSLWWALSWKPLLSVVVALLLGRGRRSPGTGTGWRGWRTFPWTGCCPYPAFTSFSGAGRHAHRGRERGPGQPHPLHPGAAAGPAGGDRTVHWACIALCLLALWAVQVGALLVLSGVYCRLRTRPMSRDRRCSWPPTGSTCSNQLLPLEAWSTWVRNAVLFLGLSLACACLASRMRQGRGSGAQVVVALLELLFLIAFSSVMPTAYGDVLVICGVLASWRSGACIWP